jgi:hypothetical protein
MVGDDTLLYLQDIVKDVYPEATFAVDEFVDPNKKTASEMVHYQGLAINKASYDESNQPKPHTVAAVRDEYRRQVQEGDINPSEMSTTLLLNPEDMDQPISDKDSKTNLQRIWEMYSERFNELTEHFPVRGTQTFEELEAMLKDPSTLTLAHKEDGDLVSFTYMADVKNCEWLNADYFADHFPGDLVLYFPGIAADKERGGQSVINLMKLLGRITEPVMDKMRLVFQCTNVSKTYVPRIVGWGIGATDVFQLTDDLKETSSYRYYGLKTQLEGEEK